MLAILELPDKAAHKGLSCSNNVASKQNQRQGPLVLSILPPKVRPSLPAATCRVWTPKALGFFEDSR